MVDRFRWNQLILLHFSRFNAVVAQLVERLLAMQKVVSSNLISRSIFLMMEHQVPKKL